MLREHRVVLDRAVQVCDLDVLVVGVCDVDRTGAIQQRRAPVREKGISVVYGNVAVSKPGTVGMITGGTSSSSSIATSGVSCVINARRTRRPQPYGTSPRPRPRTDHVRRHAAFDEPDGVMRAAQHRMIGQFHLPHHQQRVDELVDRGDAELGE